MLDSICILLILIFNQSMYISINAHSNLDVKPGVSVYPTYQFISSKTNPVYNAHLPQQELNFVKPMKYQTINSHYGIEVSTAIDSFQGKPLLNPKNNWNYITEQRSGNTIPLNIQPPLELHHGYRYTVPAIGFSNNTNLKNVIYNELGLTENNNEVNVRPHGFALKQSQLEFQKTFNFIPGNVNTEVPSDSKKYNYQNSNITTILTPVKNLIFPLKHQPHELSSNFSEISLLKQHNLKDTLNAEKGSKINKTYEEISNTKSQNFNTANSTLESMLQSNNYLNQVFHGSNLPNIDILTNADHNKFNIKKLSLNITPNVQSINVTTEPSTQSAVKINDNKSITDAGYKQLPQNDTLQDSFKLNVINSNQHVECSSFPKTTDINISYKPTTNSEPLNSLYLHNLNKFPIQGQMYHEEQNNNIYSTIPAKYDQHQTSPNSEYIPVQKLPNKLSNSNKQLLDDQLYYPSTSLYKNPFEYIPNIKDNDFNLPHSIKLDNHKEQYQLYYKNQINNTQNYQTTNVTTNKIIFPIEQNQNYYFNSPSTTSIPTFSSNAQNNYPEKENHAALLGNRQKNGYNLLYNQIPLVQHQKIPQNISFLNNLYINRELINRQIDPRTASNANKNSININYKFNGSGILSTKSPQLAEEQQLLHKNWHNYQNQALLNNNRNKNIHNLLNQITTTQQLQPQHGNPFYSNTDMSIEQINPPSASTTNENYININQMSSANVFLSSKLPQISDVPLQDSNRENSQNAYIIKFNELSRPRVEYVNREIKSKPTSNKKENYVNVKNISHEQESSSPSVDNVLNNNITHYKPVNYLKTSNKQLRSPHLIYGTPF